MADLNGINPNLGSQVNSYTNNNKDGSSSSSSNQQPQQDSQETQITNFQSPDAVLNYLNQQAQVNASAVQKKSV